MLSAAMPRKYWCSSCERTLKRLSELFARFERMNVKHIPPYLYNTFNHPGFTDPYNNN
ncbi:hypothetical protein LCGC14_2232640 [marine sediment metagenome]|uniref:Uncharacterized protein n=1 Tax=marine sediment metagenome TaxID=412755 RepID=A0A0F9D7Y6_9ZZZZ